MKSKINIIAEAGINHNGDFKKAMKLVKIASEAEVDFVKFQLFKTENFINKKFSHKKINYLKIFKRFSSLEFSIKEWKKIINYGNKLNVKVFFSVFDSESLKTLSMLGVKIIKIPSGEINNIPLLKKINKKNYKVILSTGMSTYDEITKAVKSLNKCNLSLLHCVSEYPTMNPNLRNIISLKKKYKLKVGYSDHTNDILTPALAVITGAQIIEKHFTYNKKQKVGDHKFSLSPKELKQMVNNIRFAEKSIGSSNRKVTKKESNLKFFARKGIYLNKNKKKGQKIFMTDLDILRPEGNYPVDKMHLIKNKILLKDLKKHQSIKPKFFR